MKNARGYGSDPRGMANRQTAGNHQVGVLRLGRPDDRVKVQGLNTSLAGTPWETMQRYRNRATAERVAQLQRVDNPDRLVRVR